MPINHLNNLSYFSFNHFPPERVGQAIFTRQGGCSPEPWSSLNLGGTVGDSDENVIFNKKLLFNSIQRPFESSFDVWQVHSTDIVCTQEPRPVHQPHVKADGIITNKPEITLLMRFADCVPILLYDPVKHVAGLVHAGWQGTVKMTAKFAVAEMVKTYQCQPDDMIAGIGPSIGPDHYEVGQDVIAQVKLAFGEFARDLLTQKSERIYFNLWKANEKILKLAGVNHIEIAEICTACNLSDWYSHRAEKGKTGRFGAVIYLK